MSAVFGALLDILRIMYNKAWIDKTSNFILFFYLDILMRVISQSVPPDADGPDDAQRFGYDVSFARVIVATLS